MHRLLTLSTTLILLFAASCATKPPPVMLGLSHITCPASLQEHEAGPGPFDRAILEALPPPVREYVLDWASQWEETLDAANAKADDALEACDDFNRRSAEARAVAVAQ
jgi:hypothetical protein